VWYYLFQQPWSMFPWTLATLVGLVGSARSVFRGDAPSVRFLWCWALLPVIFFSLFKGKHHHYMLSCLAPTAALAALGARSLWRWMRDWPSPWRRPWFWLTLALPAAVLIMVFGRKIPGPEWVRWIIAAGCPVAAALAAWLSCNRNGRVAFVGACVGVVAINSFFYIHRARYLDSYEGDEAFVDQVKAIASNDRPLLVICDVHPLTSSWLLYYLGERAQLLHNITFLRDDRLTAPQVYLVCRHEEEAALAEYGVARELARSARTRGEGSAEQRWTLYDLRFHPHLARMPGDVRISPLQATGRAPGPFLGRSLAASNASP
jgi:hypothetical protein